MADFGFWNLATQDPERIALVDPEGGALRAGELLARANRLVHGLRALGLGPGDCLATVLPNGAPMVELYLAAAQAGWYLTPINHHLTGGEVAYILADSAAKVFVAAEPFAPACRAAVEEIDFPAAARFAVGRVPGFRAYAELSDGQPETAPAERLAGPGMNYTSGPNGPPKGVGRPLAASDPDTVA